MKIIDLEQGSPSWLSWRKTVITGTDCPAIRGSSPWSTPYKCWQKKLDLAPEQKMNDAMERGKRLEPEARAKFIELFGINMVPAVVESSEFDFLGASLDGLSDCKKFILEVKCGGEKLHSMACDKEIPPYYMDQIQHQLLVTGAEKAFYYSYNGSYGICIEVFPDPKFKEEFLPVARDFWKCIALMEPPHLQSSDYKDMSYEPSWKQLSQEYRTICSQIKDLEKIKEKYREELLSLCGDENCMGAGIKTMKTVIRGRIDYNDIVELMGINLEKYRKESTTAWKIFLV